MDAKETAPDNFIARVPDFPTGKDAFRKHAPSSVDQFINVISVAVGSQDW